MKDERKRRQRRQTWKWWFSFFMFFCLRGLLTPLLIRNQNYMIIHDWDVDSPRVFRYREVFVFGIRIIRYQLP